MSMPAVKWTRENIKKTNKQNKNPHAQFGRPISNSLWGKTKKSESKETSNVPCGYSGFYLCMHLVGKKRINKINNIKPFWKYNLKKS